MITLSRGQKIPLNNIISHGSVQVTVTYQPATIDIAAFGLTADRTIGDDRYVILFSNQQSPDASMRLTPGNGQAQFTFDLGRLPPMIDRIILTATNDHAPISQAHELTVSFGQNAAVYNVRDGLTTETAVMMIELYRHTGTWRVGMIGQGFNGGLAKLVEHFGGDVESPAPKSAPTPKLNLNKVILEKKQSISLTKAGNDFGEITINLNWSRGTPKKRGLFGRIQTGNAIDLDLGCLYVLKNGQKSVVQALGNKFGSFQNAPYIELSGDDRTGDVSDGETIRINGRHFDEIERLAIFAYIYEGVPNWAETNGVVTISSPGQPPLEMHMTDGRNNMGMCGIALIDNDGGKMKVSRLVEYFKGHKDFADSVGIRLRWVAGSKD